VIKWPVKLYARFFNVFLRFFQNPKNMTFYVFLSCCTRFPEQCREVSNRQHTSYYINDGTEVDFIIQKRKDSKSDQDIHTHTQTSRKKATSLLTRQLPQLNGCSK